MAKDRAVRRHQDRKARDAKARRLYFDGRDYDPRDLARLRRGPTEGGVGYKRIVQDAKAAAHLASHAG